MNYGYSRQVDLSFEEADSKLREVLMERGFGVITEVDIHQKLKEKLNVDFPRYRILGACNPPVAHEVLTLEKSIGLLLPCNVVLWDNEDNTVTVAAIDAVKMLSVTGREDLAEKAENINSLLKSAIDAV